MANLLSLNNENILLGSHRSGEKHEVWWVKTFTKRALFFAQGFTTLVILV